MNINQPQEIEGLASCLDYFKVLAKTDPVSAKIQAEYDKEFPGKYLFAAGSAATGMYRGLKLWEAAVKEAGKVDRDFVGNARSCQDRRGTGGGGRNGARQTSLQDAHVYGSGEGRKL